MRDGGGERRVGGDGFQTAAIAAAARLAVHFNSHMSQFARQAAVPGEDAARIDNADAQALR